MKWAILGGLIVAALAFAGAAHVERSGAAADPIIAVAGDIACDPAKTSTTGCRQKATSDLIYNQGYAAVLPLGDNQYYCGKLTAFEQSYGPTWGRFKSITHPAVGNHEYSDSGHCPEGTNHAQGYYTYFGQAASPLQSDCTSACLGYYSFDVGGWHLIALNTQCAEVDGCSASSPQGRWLAADLAAHRNQCLLAYWHIPRFSSGGRASSNSASFWTALYNAHADVVLNGHDHIYERFALQSPSGTADPKGIRQFTVGTGGADHTTITTVARNSQVRNANTFGILKLGLHDGSYTWQFVPQAGQTFTDSGAGQCHNASGDGQPPSIPSGLQAAASGRAAQLSWSASTDNVGVDHYVVRRDGTDVGHPIGTSFLDQGLLPSTTYSYTVSACDVAGNCSAPSAPASATTPAGTFFVMPVADATVDSSAVSANYGTRSTLRVDGAPKVRSYLRFTVSGLGGSAASATLRIWAGSSQSTGFGVFRVGDNSWSETGITYANQPAASIAPSATGASGPVTAGSWTSVKVSSVVTGNGTYSFVLKTTGVTALALASREDSAHMPQLVIKTQ